MTAHLILCVIGKCLSYIVSGTKRGAKEVLLKKIVDEALDISSNQGHDVKVKQQKHLGPSQHSSRLLQTEFTTAKAAVSSCMAYGKEF
jgi:hypothetical protein